MTRVEARQDKFESLLTDMYKAFERAQWFWASSYYQNHLKVTERHLAAYIAKYGPFTATLTDQNVPGSAYVVEYK